VDVSAVDDLKAAVRLAGQAMSALLDVAKTDRPMAVRVVFKGRSAAHCDLAADEGQLRQEVIAQAVALDADRIWIEKVRVASEPLVVDQVPSGADSQDALVELEKLVLSALDDADFVRALQADWQALLEKLPHDVLQTVPELASLRQDALANAPERIRQAVPLLMARVGHRDHLSA
jgi:exonuclease SbcD